MRRLWRRYTAAMATVGVLLVLVVAAVLTGIAWRAYGALMDDQATAPGMRPADPHARPTWPSWSAISNAIQGALGKPSSQGGTGLLARDQAAAAAWFAGLFR